MIRVGRLHMHGRAGPVFGSSPSRREGIDSEAVLGLGRIWMRQLCRSPMNSQQLHEGSCFRVTNVAGEALEMVGAAQSAYELASQMATALCAYPVGLLSIGPRVVS